MRTRIDRTDVQVNVLEGVGHRHGHHLIARIGDPDDTRALLRELVPFIGDARPWPEKPAVVRNLAISAAGLRRLGVTEDLEHLFGTAFSAGMATRAGILGDVGPSDPATWHHGFESGSPLLLLWIHGETPEVVDDEVAVWRPRLDLVHQLPVSMHSHAREQFGFGDGFSQPAVAGVARQPGQEGRLDRGRHEKPLAAGEFLFGHRDAMGVVGPTARSALARNGTILVWRQLQQDVAGFRAAAAERGAALGLDPGLVAAKLVGRWPDGTPLVLAPDAPPSVPTDRLRLNDFRYREDPVGLGCPLGAHVRRANPRDGLEFPEMATRHRIIRRGLPYGPPLPEGAADDGVDRGLVFVALNASPERQFEFIQQLWCNDGSRVGTGIDRDPLIGAPGPGAGRFVLGGRPPSLLDGLPSFVTTRAGEYFLLPGLAALRGLATA